MEDVPWVRAIEACTGEVFRSKFHPHQCKSIVTVLATGRATHQLLPALRTIHARADAAAKAKAKAKATARSPVPGSNDASAAVSLAKASTLLSLLERQPGSPHGIRIDFPKHGGRVGGSGIPLAAEAVLGLPLTAGLTGSSAEPTGETERGVGTPSGSDERGRGRGVEEATEAAPLALGPDRCELRVMVDGSIVHVAAVPPTGRLRVARGLSVRYPPRCSGHPARDRLGAMTRAGWWEENQDAWYLEARVVERVCTGDAFGAHEMRAELACWESRGLSPAAASGKEEQAAGDGADEPGLSSRGCRVLASTPPTEFFHTANGAESTPVPDGGGSAVGLLDPPPVDVSVSLYLDAPASTSTVGEGLVSVPRWSTDGEAWEVRWAMTFAHGRDR